MEDDPTKSLRWTWKEENVEKFKKIILEEWENHKSGRSVEEDIQELERSMKVAALKCKMRTRNNKSTWYTQECKEERTKVKKLLKRYLKTKKTEDRKNLFEARAQLKKLYKEKKKEWRERKWTLVEQSKDISGFWSAIRGFRPKRKRNYANISKVDMVNHFKALLGEKDE